MKPGAKDNRSEGLIAGNALGIGHRWNHMTSETSGQFESRAETCVADVVLAWYDYCVYSFLILEPAMHTKFSEQAFSYMHIIQYHTVPLLSDVSPSVTHPVSVLAWLRSRRASIHANSISFALQKRSALTTESFSFTWDKCTQATPNKSTHHIK